MNSAASSPRIVTFYSYKGGTGRSMALANVAWILASNGKRVLVLDWDLEAPGLHRYFHPFLEDPEATRSNGIIDFVMNYAREAAKPRKTAKADWHVPLANIRRYATSLRHIFPEGNQKPSADEPPLRGTIDFVPAGRQGPDYSARVNSFDWQGFYERFNGGIFIEATKRSMQGYDYVLVDSRTGVSDTSGICTIQMPDTLVVCFTPNAQSIEGAAAVAESAVAQRRRPDGKPGIVVYPVMTRVTKGETQRIQLAQSAARARFDPLLWHIAEDFRDVYWGMATVGHEPFYAFEEVLAVFADPPDNPNTMLAAMESIAGWLSTEVEPLRVQGSQLHDISSCRLPTIEPSGRQGLLSRYARSAVPQSKMAKPSPVVAPAPAETPVESEKQNDPGYVSRMHVSGGDGSRISQSIFVRDSPHQPQQPRDRFFYVSFARSEDDAYLRRFIEDLRTQVSERYGNEISFFFESVPYGVNTEVLAKALVSSRTMVAIMSPSYFASAIGGREFEYFRKYGGGRSILPIIWYPLDDARIPEAVRSLQLWDEGAPEEYNRRGLRQLLALRRRQDSYQEFLAHFSERVVKIALDSPVVAPAEIPSFDDIANAFESSHVEQGHTDRFRRARFLFLVPTRDEAKELNQSDAEYGSHRSEWKPFEQKIGLIALMAASQRALVFEELLGDDDLYSKLLKTAGNHEVVIVAIDYRASMYPNLRRHLEWLGKNNLMNCALLVITPPLSDSTSVQDTLQLIRSADTLAPLVESDAEISELLSRMIERTLLRVLNRAVSDQPMASSVPLPQLSPPGHL